MHGWWHLQWTLHVHHAPLGAFKAYFVHTQCTGEFNNLVYYTCSLLHAHPVCKWYDLFTSLAHPVRKVRCWRMCCTRREHYGSTTCTNSEFLHGERAATLNFVPQYWIDGEKQRVHGSLMCWKISDCCNFQEYKCSMESIYRSCSDTRMQ